MIPHLVTVRRRRPGGRRQNWHLPVLIVALLTSPLLALAALAGLVLCLFARVNPLRAAHRTGQFLLALRGSYLEVEQGESALSVHIR
jgi:hypothetical protein